MLTTSGPESKPWLISHFKRVRPAPQYHCHSMTPKSSDTSLPSTGMEAWALGSSWLVVHGTHLQVLRISL